MIKGGTFVMYMHTYTTLIYWYIYILNIYNIYTHFHHAHNIHTHL